MENTMKISEFIKLLKTHIKEYNDSINLTTIRVLNDQLGPEEISLSALIRIMYSLIKDNGDVDINIDGNVFDLNKKSTKKKFINIVLIPKIVTSDLIKVEDD